MEPENYKEYMFESLGEYHISFVGLLNITIVLFVIIYGEIDTKNAKLLCVHVLTVSIS